MTAKLPIGQLKMKQKVKIPIAQQSNKISFLLNKGNYKVWDDNPDLILQFKDEYIHYNLKWIRENDSTALVEQMYCLLQACSSDRSGLT